MVARWRQAPWRASQRWLQQTARPASAAAAASPLVEPWPSFAPSPQRGVHENGVLCSHVQRQRRLSGRSSAAGHLKFLNSSGRVACFGAIFARKRTARGQDSNPLLAGDHFCRSCLARGYWLLRSDECCCRSRSRGKACARHHRVCHWCSWLRGRSPGSTAFASRHSCARHWCVLACFHCVPGLADACIHSTQFATQPVLVQST